MKVGDLVRYKTHNGEWGPFVGVVVRQVSGTDEIQVIRWPLGTHSGYPRKQLEVVSESR